MSSKLEKQCNSIGIDIIGGDFDFKGRPEPFVLGLYETDGYIGSSLEGTTILVVLRAVLLDKLEELSTFKKGKRDDACARGTEAQFEIQKGIGNIDLLVEHILRVDRSVFESNLREILSSPIVNMLTPGLKEDCCMAVFDALTKDQLKSIALALAEDPYKYRAGWPDLTLVKDGVLSFVEVKVKDSLLKSQVDTITRMKSALPAVNFSVFRIG